MTAISLLMFPTLFGLMFLGFPVAWSLVVTAFVFGFAHFGDAVFFQFVQKIEGTASNFVLAAVPLFVFMGSMLERSGIAERLFAAVHLWTRKLPGGLAIGTIVMCVIFAASTGVIGATETVVGLLAIPGMLKYNYSKPLICGVICAGGSLGTIIPPSVVVVVLGPVANVSIGDLLVGMLIPGLLLATTYIVYTYVLCLIWPETAPMVPDSADDPTFAEKLKTTLYALVPPMLMIFAVLGSIMAGIAEPTAAAAVGALLSVLLAIAYGKCSWLSLWEALVKTLVITSMIMFILMAGSIFTGVFVAMGGMGVMRQLIGALNLDPWSMLVLFLFLVFLAGFFLEWVSIILIFVPIFMPFIKAAGFDPVWFCILILLMIQTSYLTPPMAPAIFYLRGVAPPEIRLKDMYWGVIPFICLQFLTTGIVMAFPQTVLWLPSVLLGFK